MFPRTKPMGRGPLFFSALFSAIFSIVLCEGCSAPESRMRADVRGQWRSQINNTDILSTPLVRLNGRTLKIFHSDWFAINGDEKRKMPTSVPWPELLHSEPPYILELHTSVAPAWIEMRSFRGGDNKLKEAVLGKRWRCEIEAKKCTTSIVDGMVKIALPEKLFAEGGHKFTFQALWNVPPPQRHPRYRNVGAVTATWLYNQK